jgi:hypothetical protein
MARVTQNRRRRRWHLPKSHHLRHSKIRRGSFLVSKSRKNDAVPVSDRDLSRHHGRMCSYRHLPLHHWSESLWCPSCKRPSAGSWRCCEVRAAGPTTTLWFALLRGQTTHVRLKRIQTPAHRMMGTARKGHSRRLRGHRAYRLRHTEIRRRRSRPCLNVAVKFITSRCHKRTIIQLCECSRLGDCGLRHSHRVRDSRIALL